MTDPCNALVAVLIPYYQRTPGILAATVRAVLAQKGYDNYRIIVVDDGSPVAARDELAGLLSTSDKLTIVEQPNAGPGAARNKALDHLPSGTRYVAFLDSDDQLAENYLADAVHALDLGYDLFFGNSKRAELDGTRFDWEDRSGATLDPAAHRLIDPDRELYEFQGDFFDFVVYRSNIIGPSTMVYRLAPGAMVRFNEQVYNGQDRIFKLALCRQMHKVTFSPRVYAEEGKGINIFDSAGWGSERSLAFAASYIQMCRVILAEIPLNRQQRAHVRQHLADCRHGFVASLLNQARQGQRLDWRLVARTLRRDPGTLLSMPSSLLRIAGSKLRRIPGA